MSENTALEAVFDFEEDGIFALAMAGFSDSQAKLTATLFSLEGLESPKIETF